MKPNTVVVSLPVTNLERTLRFYRDGLGIETPGIDEGIILIELPNLSLFLMECQEYAKYARYGGLTDAGNPTPGACIFSCAGRFAWTAASRPTRTSSSGRRT